MKHCPKWSLVLFCLATVSAWALGSSRTPSERQSGSRRLFLALRIEAPLAEQLVAAQDSLKSDGFVLDWEPKANLHLTLHYLGQVDDTRLPALEKALEEVAAGQKGFSLDFCGLGYFTEAGKSAPTVVWAGCGGWKERVVRLANEISRALVRIGFPPRGRPFVPHVTLGWPTEPDQAGQLRQRIDEERGRPFGTYFIPGFSLYESLQEDGRTVYRHLREFRLR